MTSCCSVTVTFWPCATTLKAQIASIPESWLVVVVDNGSPDSLWQGALDVLKTHNNLSVIRLDENGGLAAAQNRGIELAESLGVELVLLLDQDTVPMMGSIEELVAAYGRLSSQGVAVGALGPRLVDPTSGIEHGFHQMSRVGWKRVSPSESEPLEVAGLNGSGTLVPAAVLLEVGGMDECLFIDHVDTEWSFRLASTGRRLIGVPTASFEHSMGQSTRRVWIAGWRTWPVRTPGRHRYLFRNTFHLLRKPYVPKRWKFWSCVKLLVTFFYFVSIGPERLQQCRSMVLGVIDGIVGRCGSIPG